MDSDTNEIEMFNRIKRPRTPREYLLRAGEEDEGESKTKNIKLASEEKETSFKNIEDKFIHVITPSDDTQIPDRRNAITSSKKEPIGDLISRLICVCNKHNKNKNRRGKLNRFSLDGSDLQTPLLSSDKDAITHTSISILSSSAKEEEEEEKKNEEETIALQQARNEAIFLASFEPDLSPIKELEVNISELNIFSDASSSSSSSSSSSAKDDVPIDLGSSSTSNEDTSILYRTTMANAFWNKFLSDPFTITADEILNQMWKELTEVNTETAALFENLLRYSESGSMATHASSGSVIRFLPESINKIISHSNLIYLVLSLSLFLPDVGHLVSRSQKSPLLSIKDLFVLSESDYVDIFSRMGVIFNKGYIASNISQDAELPSRYKKVVSSLNKTTVAFGDTYICFACHGLVLSDFSFFMNRRKLLNSDFYVINRPSFISFFYRKINFKGQIAHVYNMNIFYQINHKSVLIFQYLFIYNEKSKKATFQMGQYMTTVFNAVDLHHLIIEYFSLPNNDFFANNYPFGLAVFDNDILDSENQPVPELINKPFDMLDRAREVDPKLYESMNTYGKVENLYLSKERLNIMLAPFIESQSSE